MTIWKTLLSIQQNTTSISLRTITSRISSLKLFQPQDTLLEVFLLSLIKKKLYFLVMPSLKKQLDAGTFQQGTTNNYSLVLKNNSLHFLTTTEFSQVMDGTPLLVTRRSLTHIFHKNKSLSTPTLVSIDKLFSRIKKKADRPSYLKHCVHLDLM